MGIGMRYGGAYANNGFCGCLYNIAYTMVSFSSDVDTCGVFANLQYVCKAVETSSSPFTCPATCSNPVRLYSSMPSILGSTATQIPAGLAIGLLLFMVAIVVHRHSAGRSSAAQIDEGFSTDLGSRSHEGWELTKPVLISRE